MHHDYFLHHFVDKGNGLSSFFGSFLGAFFAFVFGIITYAITKRRDRFVQHKNTLVRLERVLNKHLEDLGTLEIFVQNMKANLSERRVDIGRLFKIQIPDDLDTGLGSIDLINKFFSYQVSIDRINHNVSTINHALTRIEDLFIGGQPVAVENFDLIIKILDGLIKDLPRMNDRTIKFFSVIRIHNRKIKYKNSYVYGVLNTLWEQDISDMEKTQEQENLRKEIERPENQDHENIF